jgi:PIN domain nuclease of toxin-antitoxin system
VDVDGRGKRAVVRGETQAPVILLDTHAVIWLAQRHRRARPLEQFARLYLSPASLLEIQFLADIGRVRLSGGVSPMALVEDARWRLDEPLSAKWFATACEMGWTRDPFDRLLAAHARMRGWKLATADDVLLDHLEASEVLPL